MLYKIADLFAEIPETGGLASRCRDYLYTENVQPNIVIKEELYDPSKYSPMISANNLAYMESGRQFCARLLEYNGFYLHSSAVALDGEAYLFSANSGVGKSTHTRFWQSVFGEEAKVFNDDKPALRFINETWYAYGTPWCGKDGININMRVPIRAICFLKRAEENKIRKLNQTEAIQRILPQTIYRFKKTDHLDLLFGHLEKLLRVIPIYELENKPEPEAALLSYRTMSGKDHI